MAAAVNALSALPRPELLRRVRSEFDEMPGLRLTSAQAQRLWHLDADQCDAVFAALIEERALRRTPDGAFIRA